MADERKKQKQKKAFTYEPVKEPPEDDKIKVILGPAYTFFRRSWEEDGTPIAILGSNQRSNTLFHLVRIVTKADEKNIEEILKDPYENLGDNLRITLTEVLEGTHPELLINYYKNNTVFVENTKTEVEKEKDAESVLATCSQMKWEKKKKTYEHPRDLEQIKTIKDSYGLPEFFDSDFDDLDDLSSSDSDDNVQDLPFEAKVKRSKKKSEDEKPKKKVKLDEDGQEKKTKKSKKKKVTENEEGKTVTEKRKKKKSKTGNEKKCKTVTENEVVAGTSGTNTENTTVKGIDENLGTLRLSESDSE